MDHTDNSAGWRRWGAGAALGVAGLLAGGVAEGRAEAEPGRARPPSYVVGVPVRQP